VDLDSGHKLRTLNGDAGNINCLAGADGLLVVSGSEDKALKVWDLTTGTQRLTLTGHTGEVTSCGFERKMRLCTLRLFGWHRDGLFPTLLANIEER
jgi:WD40 repeat protein